MRRDRVIAIDLTFCNKLAHVVRLPHSYQTQFQFLSIKRISVNEHECVCVRERAYNVIFIFRFINFQNDTENKSCVDVKILIV